MSVSGKLGLCPARAPFSGRRQHRARRRSLDAVDTFNVAERRYDDFRYGESGVIVRGVRDARGASDTVQG